MNPTSQTNIKLPKSQTTGFFIICHTQDISKRGNPRSVAIRVYRVQERDQLKLQRKKKCYSSARISEKACTHSIEWVNRANQGKGCEVGQHAPAASQDTTPREMFIQQSEHTAILSPLVSQLYPQKPNNLLSWYSHLPTSTCNKLKKLKRERRMERDLFPEVRDSDLQGTVPPAQVYPTSLGLCRNIL